MKSIKHKIFRVAFGRDYSPSQDKQVTVRELLYYLWKRGGWSFLRGLFLRHRFKECGGRLLIGKSVNILFPKYISLGKNVALGDYTYVNGFSQEGLRLGNNVRIREHGWIQATSTLENPGKGLVILDNTYIGPRCIIGAGGGITIGSNVTTGAGVELLAEDHMFSDAKLPINEQGVARKGIVIEDDVWIGNRVIVLDGVRVSRGAVIGAGSIVTKDVPPDTIVAGNPARAIGQRDSPLRAADPFSPLPGDLDARS